jgi:hypothetical protein
MNSPQQVAGACAVYNKLDGSTSSYRPFIAEAAAVRNTCVRALLEFGLDELLKMLPCDTDVQLGGCSFWWQRGGQEVITGGR